jgi:hypothetical protein
LQDGDTHVGSPSSARQYIAWPGGARSSREREARATDRRLRPRSVDHVRPIRIRHWSSVPSEPRTCGSCPAWCAARRTPFRDVFGRFVAGNSRC